MIKRRSINGEYFLESKSLGGRVKVELDLSNIVTKTDLKNATGTNTSSYGKYVDLASLKSNIDKLDIDKLRKVRTNLNDLESKVDKLHVHKLIPVPVDLSKLSDLVKHNVVKKDVYNAKINKVEDKMLDITNLATETTFNSKIDGAKGEIPNITRLTTTISLTAVEKQIPNE